MNKLTVEQLDFSKSDKLIPAIIQDINTLQVLMLGYLNEEAFEATINSGKVTFYSRSKKRLWTKGETSGNFLYPVKIIPDCDFDAVLILVTTEGPTCHLKTDSCFKNSVKVKPHFLEQLESIIDKRFNNRSDESYTCRLFAEGINRIAQKVGEEGVEIAIAAVTDTSKDLFLGEAADLIYHLLVLLRAKEANFDEVLAVLKKRAEEKNVMG